MKRMAWRAAVTGAVALTVLVGGACESRQARQKRELAQLVQQLAAFATNVSQVQAKLTGGVSGEQFQGMYMQLGDMLGKVERPITQNQRVERLYELAREVIGSVNAASEQGVRSLAMAGGDDEYQQVSQRAADRIAGEFVRAATAFLQDYAAAQREIAQTNTN
jgi:hypothetical protein